MSLEGWKSLFEMGGVILLALTFVFGAGALIVNNRLNAVQAQELSDFKLKFEGEQQKTALAQKEAAEAKQLAGGFERDIATANQRAAEAGEKAESERLARVKLQKELSPRRLTGEQINKLSQSMRDTPLAVAIVSAMIDGESSDFADDFDTAFRAAGWKTVRIKLRATEERGVEVGVLGEPGLPPNVTPLLEKVRNALGDVNVSSKITPFRADDHSWGTIEKHVLYLVVNHKPEVTGVRP